MEWRKFSWLDALELDFLRDEAAREDLPKGDILCAGVFLGGDVVELRKAKPYRHIIVVDSFEGLAKPCDKDLEGAENPALEGECNPLGIGDFSTTMKLFDVDNLELFKVWIDDEQIKYVGKRKLAMIWLDLDHYNPTLSCMKYFWPMLQPGGWMLTHDYGFDRCQGIKRAADDFGGEWMQRAGYIWGRQK